ncbi:MAG: hypothetical protein GY937_21725 [bacterium]|nr:hypothetical protein [bacterium]
MPNSDWIDLALKVATPTFVFLGGLYAMFEYRRFRRYGHKMELELDFDVIPLPGPPGSYVLDIKPRIKNLGLVRQSFPLIFLWASALRDTDVEAAKEGDGHLKMLDHVLTPRNLSNPEDPYFVDPGVSQVFPYQAVVETTSSHVKVVVCSYYRISWFAVPAARWRRKRQLRRARSKGDEKQAKSVEETLERLEEYRVDWFHTAVSVKAVPQNDR